MVNAFLLATTSCLEESVQTQDGERVFRESLQRLDKKRLGKQRVEAMQILNNIEDLHHFARLMSYPLSEDPTEWRTWVDNVIATYHSWNYRYVMVNRYWRVAITKEQAEAGKFEYPYRLVTMNGFMKHPAIIAWLKWPQAMRQYLNLSRLGFEARGGTNDKIKVYPVNLNIEYPPWIFSPVVHNNFKAALIFKELSNKEAAWYMNMKDCVEAGKRYDTVKPLFRLHRLNLIPDRVKGQRAEFKEYIWPYGDWDPETEETRNYK